MSRICADHTNHAVAANDLALTTDALN